MDPSAFASGTYRSFRPSGLHCNLAAAEHRSWSFAEDRHSSRCAFAAAFTATDLRSRRSSALWLPHLAMLSATQDLHHAPCFELPDQKSSPSSFPASRATRRSRCPEQPHRVPSSARRSGWTGHSTAAKSFVAFTTAFAPATYLAVSVRSCRYRLLRTTDAVSHIGCVAVPSATDLDRLPHQVGAYDLRIRLTPDAPSGRLRLSAFLRVTPQSFLLRSAVYLIRRRLHLGQGTCSPTLV